jgi:hypothetical protein
MTKKLYGQAVTADEINKLLGETLEVLSKSRISIFWAIHYPIWKRLRKLTGSEPKELSFLFRYWTQP